MRDASRAQRVLPWCMVVAVAFAGHAMAAPDPSAQRLCDAYDGVPKRFGPARGAEPNRPGMVRIPAGQFRMGSDAGYPEERNVHVVRLDSFLIDRHHVTNAEFALFVRATGYVTMAERRRDARDFPGVPESQLVPGSVVFNWPVAGSGSITRTDGGSSSPAPVGGTPPGRAATCEGWPIIPSCM